MKVVYFKTLQMNERPVLKTPKAEIHMHSTFSDGEFTPSRLVEIAQKNDVKVLSLTDHDSFEGIDDFITAAEPTDIFAFPGIEITVRFRDFNLHVLGYFKDSKSLGGGLCDRVKAMKELRENRMHELIERIDAVVPEKFRGAITFDNVRKAAEGVIARPHLAREMVRLGIVPNTPAAFDQYLVKYNVEKDNISAEEAIDLIRKNAGVPVLAHPGERTYSIINTKNGRSLKDAEVYLEELKAYGLLGMECVYPYHERSGTVKLFLDLAEKYGLIATGSRDFHGFHYAQSTDHLGATQKLPPFLDQFKEAWG